MAPSSESTISNLIVSGTLSPALSGQLIGVAPDGLIHSVQISAGRAPAYRSRRPIADGVVSSVITFGGSILAIVVGELAYELSWDLASLRQVDLAGQSRLITGYPKVDAVTGELHMLAIGALGEKAYVVVSAGGLTRSSRSITDAPRELTVGPSPTDSAAAGNWHVGFLRDPRTDALDLVVLTTSDPSGVAVASVHLPRGVPSGLHSTWIPAPHQSTTTNQGAIK